MRATCTPSAAPLTQINPSAHRLLVLKDESTEFASMIENGFDIMDEAVFSFICKMSKTMDAVHILQNSYNTGRARFQSGMRSSANILRVIDRVSVWCWAAACLVVYRLVLTGESLAAAGPDHGQ